MLGPVAAKKMLDDGWKPTAQEAKEIGVIKKIKVLSLHMNFIGLVKEVVPHEELMVRAQDMAETWVKAGKKKEIPGGEQTLEDLDNLYS